MPKVAAWFTAVVQTEYVPGCSNCLGNNEFSLAPTAAQEGKNISLLCLLVFKVCISILSHCAFICFNGLPGHELSFMTSMAHTWFSCPHG